ncbi:phage terminase small subunit P27 family [Salipiger sp. PrR003]|uniref:phage terminase small subunit P27 family n=1 Tax=Salipiger sp. PrR003 TaxID=2706776 RepID=UPI0013DC7C44|nr:phage terminase small subunit P27 family [Salipiger sp. PrR003]NDV52162.1 phage terminase small subunit P27 family [Salipiger sp. PrR003]NDV52188.1 phage terminase small subunit P27 family [Salipiger sp. PrR003]
MRGVKPHIRVEREPLADRPAPDYLSADARAEWNRIVPILAKRKILTEADVGCIENYCMAIGTVREMDREIQRVGAVQKVFKIDKEGVSVLTSIRKNPAVSIRAEAMTQSRLYAAELGATPVSRSRPTVDDDDDDDDLFGWTGG